ncbi:MAG: DUF6452 family protein [Prolixibacteraceae bacterium]|jgi:hypothetical protein|nr:DUF6452 family protein [Prolixibacteraceae bacterium]
MLQKILLKILFWTAAALAFLSCDELPCEDPDGAQANLSFFTIERGGLSDTLIDSLTVILLNDETNPYGIFYKTVTNKISVPLSLNEDTTTMIFLYKDSIADTLIFRYSRFMNLPSHECGFVTFFEINDIATSSNRLDSAWISKSTVENGEFENVKIYF